MPHDVPLHIRSSDPRSLGRSFSRVPHSCRPLAPEQPAAARPGPGPASPPQAKFTNFEVSHFILPSQPSFGCEDFGVLFVPRMSSDSDEVKSDGGEVDSTLSNSDVVTKYRLAAQVAQTALQGVLTQLTVGKSVSLPAWRVWRGLACVASRVADGCIVPACVHLPMCQPPSLRPSASSFVVGVVPGLCGSRCVLFLGWPRRVLALCV